MHQAGHENQNDKSIENNEEQKTIIYQKDNIADNTDILNQSFGPTKNEIYNEDLTMPVNEKNAKNINDFQ